MKGRDRNVLSRILNFIFRIRLRLADENNRATLMKGRFHYIGNNVKLYTVNFGTEPYLISIHDNVTCAADVTFITHDVSCFNISRIINMEDGSLDKVGKIVLYENAFIGAKTILMPNTTVGPNSIVAAGSVVTKNIPGGEVWGGNPAKYIMKTSEYANKLIDINRQYPWMNEQGMMCSGEELKRKRISYFFNQNTCDE